MDKQRERRFRNVPAAKQAAMERCVQRVKRQGRSKSSAIAICFESVVRGKEMSNSKIQRKRKSSKKAEQDKLMQMAEGEFLEALEEIADDVYEEDEDEEGKELSEKHALVAMEGAFVPFGGSQSWADLDKFVNAEATSSAVRQTTFEFKTMVNNVLNDEDLSLTEKTARITGLASGFSRRAGKLADEKKDVDDPGTVDILLDKIGLKQITKLEDGVNLVASDFADVPDRTKPSTWKLRLAENRSGHFTAVQIGRSITAMQPSGFRGQRVKIGSSKSAVVRRILAAINKIKGTSDDMKRNLRERLAKVKSIGFEIFKDKEGNYRWFGWVSNKWRDRDVKAHPGGEIIAEAAHKEFVDWVYEKADERMPALWLWHTPNTAVEKRADWIDYSDGFLVESGPLSEKENLMFELLSKEYDLAMSHGFFKAAYDSENGIIQKYRQFEASVLPREHVANEWTDFATLMQEAKMFTEEQRGYLVTGLGEEKVAELEASTKDMAEILKLLDVDFKKNQEIPVEEAPEKEPEKVEVKPEDGKEKEAETPEPVPALDAKALVEALGLDKLSEYLEGQEKVMAELKGTIEEQNKVIAKLSKSSDEKIAETLTPRVDAKDLEPIWLKRLSQSDDTKADEEKDKKLLAKQPGDEKSWVSQAMGAAPDPKSSVPM